MAGSPPLANRRTAVLYPRFNLPPRSNQMKMGFSYSTLMSRCSRCLSSTHSRRNCSYCIHCLRCSCWGHISVNCRSPTPLSSQGPRDFSIQIDSSAWTNGATNLWFRAGNALASHQNIVNPPSLLDWGSFHQALLGASVALKEHNPSSPLVDQNQQNPQSLHSS
jgi:hypothetical protein